MEPKETHNKIEELLSAAVDGEVSVEEHAQAEEALNSPEWASHAAFLSILKDSARFEDLIEVPSSLSERIALATYAKPTLWSRITGALRPAPMRYAAGGLALSGLAAIGLVMLKPPSVTHIPNAPVATPKAHQVAIDTPPTPDVKAIVPKPSPEPVTGEVKPTPEPPMTPEVIRTPAPAISNRRNDTVAPSVTQVPITVASGSRNHNITELPTTPKGKPTPAPTRKPTVLAPARMADPGTEAPVAVETPAPTAVATGNTTGITEGTPDLVAPRPLTIASGITDPAAALRDPSNTNARAPKNDPDAVMKISLNQGREKLNGLSGQPGAGSTSGSRMSLVNDNEKR